jgi:hypothetical protein
MHTDESHDVVGLVTLLHAAPFQRIITPSGPTAQPSLMLAMNTESKEIVVGLATVLHVLPFQWIITP